VGARGGATGQAFPTIEHGYHYRRFSDDFPEIAEKILRAPSPWAAMQVECRHKTRRRNDWQDVKVGILTELVRAKGAQNEDVRKCLLHTGAKRIVGNLPFDSFWDCGLGGQGQNMLGQILMQIRGELRASAGR
jgi:ribA/ribD-fused uncharacterized protein